MANGARNITKSEEEISLDLMRAQRASINGKKQTEGGGGSIIRQQNAARKQAGTFDDDPQMTREDKEDKQTELQVQNLQAEADGLTDTRTSMQKTPDGIEIDIDTTLPLPTTENRQTTSTSTDSGQEDTGEPQVDDKQNNQNVAPHAQSNSTDSRGGQSSPMTRKREPQDNSEANEDEEDIADEEKEFDPFSEFDDSRDESQSDNKNVQNQPSSEDGTTEDVPTSEQSVSEQGDSNQMKVDQQEQNEQDAQDTIESQQEAVVDKANKQRSKVAQKLSSMKTKRKMLKLLLWNLHMARIFLEGIESFFEFLGGLCYGSCIFALIGIVCHVIAFAIHIFLIAPLKGLIWVNSKIVEHLHKRIEKYEKLHQKLTNMIQSVQRAKRKNS